MLARTASLWLVSSLALVLMIPAASAQSADDVYDYAIQESSAAWWSIGAACEPVKDELRAQNITRDNPDTTDSKWEYDPLNRHECRHLRDDLQRKAYEYTDADENLTFWVPCVVSFFCVGFNLEGCDVWIWTFWGQCVGGIFPDNTPA